jgi:hypothetical protein
MFEPRSGHVGFVVDEAALEQIFSEYLALPANHSTGISRASNGFQRLRRIFPITEMDGDVSEGRTGRRN